MERQRGTPKMPQEDVKSLRESHGTNKASIDHLLQSGVNPDHVDDVLDIRDLLSGTWTTGDSLNTMVHQDTVSIEAITKAYRTSRGDVDLLSSLASLAESLIVPESIRPGTFTKALNRAVRMYQERGEGVFDEE